MPLRNTGVHVTRQGLERNNLVGLLDNPALGPVVPLGQGY